jgi:hypothetical protein
MLCARGDDRGNFKEKMVSSYIATLKFDSSDTTNQMSEVDIDTALQDDDGIPIQSNIWVYPKHTIQRTSTCRS